MKIVIDIPDYIYEVIKRSGSGAPKAIDDAIANGTPLPKNHGRLIDADAFIKDVCNSCDGYCEVCEVVECDCLSCTSDCRCDFIKALADAPTIIEADKGEEE